MNINTNTIILKIIKNKRKKGGKWGFEKRKHIP